MTNFPTVGITGGSGHLGTGLIMDCLQHGYIVNASYKNFCPELVHGNLNWFQGDINDSSHLEEAFGNLHILVHCAGIISMKKRPDSTMRLVNIEGTKAVINLCLRRGIKLIHISSSTATNEPKDCCAFNEIGRYRSKNDFYYGYTKAEGEREVLKAVKEYGLSAVILRPTSIIGPPDYKPSLFGRTLIGFCKGRLQMVPTGGHHLVDIRDVTRSIIHSFTKGNSGEIYLLGGPYISLKDMVKYCNPKAVVLVLPVGILIRIAPLIERISDLFNRDSAITTNSLKLVKNASKQIDCSKAKQELNHHNREIKETINDFVGWHNTRKA